MRVTHPVSMPVTINSWTITYTDRTGEPCSAFCRTESSAFGFGRWAASRGFTQVQLWSPTGDLIAD